MKKLFSLTLLLLGFATFSLAQDITGTWKTIDDETGDEKSYVEIYKSNGKYYGKVAKIITEERKDAVCEKCSGSNKNKPILGMIIIRDLEKQSNSKYANGKILDPQKGKEYHLKIFPVNENELTVEGSIKVLGMNIGRKQSWYKVD